jgi:hypothetical protein
MATLAELWEETPAQPAGKPPAAPALAPSFGKQTGQTLADLWEVTPAKAPKGKGKQREAVREIDKPFEQQTVRGLAKQYLQEMAVYPDIVTGAITAPAAITGYLTRRVMGETPEEAQATVESYMPQGGFQKLATAVGAPMVDVAADVLSGQIPRPANVMQEIPGYAESAPMQLLQKAGEITQIPTKALAERTGIAQADIENVLGAAGIAIGGARPIMGGMKRTAEAVGDVAQRAQEAARGLRPVEAPALTPEQALEQFRAAGGRVPFVEPVPETMRVIGGPEVPAQAPTPAGAPVSLLPGQPPSAGAAAVAQRPFSLTGEETARGVFPQVKLHKIGEPVPVEEQSLRATIAREIMGDQGIRTSTITGDENLLRNEIERSKLLDDSGKLTSEAEVMRAQLASEQNALSRYAEQRVTATGADPTLPDDFARGERTNDTFFGEDGLFKQIREQKRSIYDEARANVGDNPVDTPTVDKLLSSRQFKAQLKAKRLRDFTDGLQDLLDVHRTEGFEGTLPNSVASLEELRKAANALWDKDNSQFVKRVVDAIDEDIATAGGPGLYQKARAVHQAEKSLFNVPGFKKIFGEFDANEIKAGVPLERVMKEINRLPFQEWTHIHDLLDTMSKGSMPGNLRGLQMTPELQDYASSALAEMKGSLARDIYQAGATKVGEWNSNAANKMMNNYDRKLRYSLDPEEYTRYHVLNAGGQMMPSVPYEGAGRQTRRIEATADKMSEAARRAAQLTEMAAGTKGVPTFGLPQKAAEFLATTRAKESSAKSAARLQRELQQNVQKGQTKLSDILPGPRRP